MFLYPNPQLCFLQLRSVVARVGIQRSVFFASPRVFPRFSQIRVADPAGGSTPEPPKDDKIQKAIGDVRRSWRVVWCFDCSGWTACAVVDRCFSCPAVEVSSTFRLGLHSILFLSSFQLVKEHKLLVFMKGTPEEPRCGFSGGVVKILSAQGGCTHEILVPVLTPTLTLREAFLGPKQSMPRDRAFLHHRSCLF
jgi:hypothetical protein